MRTSICSSEISFVCEKRAEGGHPPEERPPLDEAVVASWWKRRSRAIIPGADDRRYCELYPTGPGLRRGDSAAVLGARAKAGLGDDVLHDRAIRRLLLD